MASQDTQSPSLEWQKSRNGTWERDVEECEKFYKLSARGNDKCYPITGCASFVTNSSSTTTTAERGNEKLWVEDALRKAWTTLCYKHPTLRSHIEHDEKTDRWKRVYSAFEDEGEEKRWFGSTFVVIDTNVEPLQWFNNNVSSFECSTLFLVRPKAGDKPHQSIFLRCPHDVTDGIGILQLVDQLFGHAALAYEQGGKYASPVWGGEHVRLSPCLRLAAAIPESFSDVQTKRFEEIQTRNGATYKHPGLLGLPRSSSAASSRQGKRQRLAISVPKAITKQITRNCKAVAPGVSVTHVFMSALVLALSELQTRKEEPCPVRYVNHSMINLRPYCRDPYCTPEHAAAAYHTVSMQALGIDLVVPAFSTSEKAESSADQLMQLATRVRDFYRTIRPVSSTDEQAILAPLMFKTLTPPLGSDPHAVSEPPFCPVPLSSIGNISSIVSPSHGCFDLTDVWAASEPIGPGVAIFLGTWNGEIQLSGVFDTQYHDANYIEKFLGRIVNCVTRGLNIDEHDTSGKVASTDVIESKKRKREDDSRGRSVEDTSQSVT